MREYMKTTPAICEITGIFLYQSSYRQLDSLPGDADISVVMAVFIYFRHTSHRFQKEYSMQQLKKQESQNWPQITPVLSLDLLKEDLDTGPWAMAKYR